MFLSRRLSASWLLAMIFTIPLFAQSSIQGQVLDETAQPLGYAGVMLLSATDSVLVKGAVTNEDGQFLFEKVDPGHYLVGTSMIGYLETFSAPIQLATGQAPVVLPPIQLANAALNLETVEVTAERPLFEQRIDRLVVNVAESVTSAGSTALEILERKKNIRILTAGPYPFGTAKLTTISGGALLQEPDRIDAPGDDPANWQLVSGEAADEATLADLVFAWRACRSVKSNAILLASGGASVGVGMGQVNRVDSCKLAVDRAGDRAVGSVAASDAFFPFNDGPQILLDAGVKAIVQPGGSVRDEQTIEACKKAGVTMYFTGTRHFFH